jgi:DMSO/TMAO reductase YedYZ molybdopterin-dependent catalytic subunit
VHISIKRQHWIGALVGVAAAGVALGIAELVAALTGPNSAPIIAVGGVVVDNVPLSVKQFATSTFGTQDKNALIVGTFVLLAIIAAVIGALAVRDIRFGYAGIVVFGVIGAVSAVTRAGAGAGAVFPSIVGAAAGAATFAVLLKGWRPPVTDLENASDRRKVLLGAIGAIVGAVIAGAIGRQLGERKNVAAARRAVVLPTPTSTVPPLPPDAAVPGQTPFVIDNEDFYRIDTALVVPQVDPGTWSLRIHGQVAKEITLTYKQLLARPMIERYITLACVSNPVGGNLIGNALFQGVPLKDLLEEAGPHPSADQVVGRSVDGFTAGSPTAVLMDGRDAMLAVAMNGAPLPVEHGFPARVVVPGLYGYVSATKWITELEVTTFAAFDAYWVPRGWSQMGPIKTESRIDTPSDGSSKAAGQVTVAGVAWAQHRGISKVEVRVDSGQWQVATLDAVPSTDTWRQWFLTWNATKGTHQLQVRATDNAGDTQTSEEAPEPPNGASGYHTIHVKID